MLPAAAGGVAVVALVAHVLGHGRKAGMQRGVNLGVGRGHLVEIVMTLGGKSQAADRCGTPDKPRFVAGALGPTNKTASISPMK